MAYSERDREMVTQSGLASSGVVRSRELYHVCVHQVFLCRVSIDHEVVMTSQSGGGGHSVAYECRKGQTFRTRHVWREGVEVATDYMHRLFALGITRTLISEWCIHADTRILHIFS